jgi:hypothetical protein
MYKATDRIKTRRRALISLTKLLFVDTQGRETGFIRARTHVGSLTKTYISSYKVVQI